MPDDSVDVLRRWADSGGIWRVAGRRAGSITVGLYECTGGAEADRITCPATPALLDYLAGRTSSED
ncbi:hypothetical protein ABIA39_003040 [Nocardia sp. GAS34]|uniref:hypothetical protein n=1 Tax=unclassified Nocardia TaxID=2637762 RepID=UPI003D22C952